MHHSTHLPTYLTETVFKTAKKICCELEKIILLSTIFYGITRIQIKLSKEIIFKNTQSLKNGTTHFLHGHTRGFSLTSLIHYNAYIK